MAEAVNETGEATQTDEIQADRRILKDRRELIYRRIFSRRYEDNLIDYTRPVHSLLIVL